MTADRVSLGVATQGSSSAATDTCQTSVVV